MVPPPSPLHREAASSLGRRVIRIHTGGKAFTLTVSFFWVCAEPYGEGGHVHTLESLYAPSFTCPVIFPTIVGRLELTSPHAPSFRNTKQLGLPQAKELQFYAQTFNACEINTTFYGR